MRADAPGFEVGELDHFGAMTKIAPSIRADPDNMFAMRLSWPGESTKLTTLNSSLFPPHRAHVGLVE